MQLRSYVLLFILNYYSVSYFFLLILQAKAFKLQPRCSKEVFNNECKGLFRASSMGHFVRPPYLYVAIDFIEQNNCEPSRYLFREQSHYESLWPVVGKILQPQFLVLMIWIVNFQSRLRRYVNDFRPVPVLNLAHFWDNITFLL